MAGRNLKVEETVALALEAIDEIIAGGEVSLPEGWKRLDAALRRGSASVRTASLFLLFYRTVDDEWDGSTIPVGIRGRYGDKLLCEELTRRSLTLHNGITAFGENLGWKGNVRGYGLASDPRFAEIHALLITPVAAEERRGWQFMRFRCSPLRGQSSRRSRRWAPTC